MDLVKITDEQGNIINFKRYNGLSFHPEVLGNVKDELDKVVRYQCRPDDVIICSFPKSGTHWVYNMVEMLRTGTLQYKGTPFVMAAQDLRELEALKHERTYLTHLSYQYIPNEAKNGKVKMVHVSRNPKDVVTSFYEYQMRMTDTSYQGNFDGFLHFFQTDEFIAAGGSWFTYVKQWENAKKSNPHLNILYLRYEDLQKDLYSNILKISKFLELKHTEDFLRNVEQSLSFGNLKKAHETKSGDTERFQHMTKDGRLPIYRKGIIGDWKNRFTVAQNEKFDAIYRQRMAEMDLDVDSFVFE